MRKSQRGRLWGPSSCVFRLNSGRWSPAPAAFIARARTRLSSGVSSAEVIDGMPKHLRVSLLILSLFSFLNFFSYHLRKILHSVIRKPFFLNVMVGLWSPLVPCSSLPSVSFVLFTLFNKLGSCVQHFFSTQCCRVLLLFDLIY